MEYLKIKVELGNLNYLKKRIEMQNKEICGEKSVNEKNLEVFNRYFPGCLSMENDGKLTLDVGRLKALLGDFSEIKEGGFKNIGLF